MTAKAEFKKGFPLTPSKNHTTKPEGVKCWLEMSVRVEPSIPQVAECSQPDSLRLRSHKYFSWWES